LTEHQPVSIVSDANVITREEFLMSAPVAAAEKNIFRKTNAHTGRQVCITPANSSMRHLAYSRIVLNSAKPSECIVTGDRETGLICLSGEATVSVDNKEITLAQRDAIYIPRDSAVKISTKTSADLAEFSCDVANRYPLQVVRASEIAKDPGLQFTTGTPGCTRHLQMLLAKNIQAGRLIAGITQADPGNWTSWPPHEHAALLEEIYVYFDMPEPAYGIQLVYNDTQNPELVTVVRDGDAVLIPSGYHPNVSVPGHRICFLWAMAAHREVEDRQFGVVNVQPGFNQGPTGLEAGRKN
jgi:5-deoxy-glucuronate isomerase